MAVVDLFNMKGEKIGNVDLADSIFGITPNEHVVHQATVQYLANQRQGTKSTLTRAEVRGGGAKPRPQKGTGRSRQGSIRSPQWVGGGVVFAPKPRNFSFKLNKKVKRLALKSVLSSKVLNGKILVIDELKFDAIKTKKMVEVLKNVKAKKALVVIHDNDKNVVLSARNIPGIKMAGVNTINVYDILKHEHLILTKDAVNKMTEVYK
jgi:large subunit ribosomal protein L4